MARFSKIFPLPSYRTFINKTPITKIAEIARSISFILLINRTAVSRFLKPKFKWAAFASVYSNALFSSTYAVLSFSPVRSRPSILQRDTTIVSILVFLLAEFILVLMLSVLRILLDTAGYTVPFKFSQAKIYESEPVLLLVSVILFTLITKSCLYEIQILQLANITTADIAFHIYTTIFLKKSILVKRFLPKFISYAQ